MTKDLEKTLDELGPGYREVVDRLRAAYRAPQPFALPKVNVAERPRSGRITGWSVGYLIAASFLVFLGIGIAFRPSQTRQWSSEPCVVYTVAYAPNEAALAAIVNSQRADGSWSNDFLTQQNAAALRSAEGFAEQIAYKKAVRYLRSKGLRPLSDEELKMRGDAAARMFAHG